MSEGPKGPGSEPSIAGDARLSESATLTDPFDDLLKRAARLTPLPTRDTTLRGRSAHSGPRTLAPGQTLWNGRFQIIERLGAGGMGVVYEAHDHVRGERVALKTLSRLNAHGIYRLKREFRALCEVAHENLVVLHELFADDDHCLFTMELITGEPFDRYVRPERSGQGSALDESRLRHTLPQLAHGVAAIHAAGKLHRDLKPSNVLVTEDGRAVILDFGLVADRGEITADSANDDDRGSGTPAYMAPEQCARSAATEASDWYAFGVMLFEALTGRLPFEDSSQRLMRRKQSEQAPAASALATPGAVAGDLEALCAKLLALEPSGRPTGAEVLETLLHIAPLRPSLDPQRRSALLGRASELAVLHNAFERANERSVVVCLAGESGMGKSALSTAFGDEVRARANALVLEGRCYEREYLPYKGLDRAIDGLMRHLRQLDPVELTLALPPDVGALARIFPVLDRVDAIASTPTRESHPGEDGHALRRRAFRALSELLSRLGARQRIVLCIDDAQWIDGDSVALLDHLLGASELKLLLVVNQRAFSDGPLLAQLAQRTRIESLEVGPLPREAVVQLALGRLHALPKERDAAALADAVAAEAHGSPFFAVELSRNMLSSSPPRAPSLEQALRERVIELGPTAQELLELLALAARPTPAAVLTLALRNTGQARERGQAQRALDRLRKAQLLRESPLGELECYHDRIRLALAEGVSAGHARALHARLAEAWSAQSGADPEVLFAHCYAAGQRAQAAMHALHAAQTSATALAFDRSASFLAHAIELLPEADVRAKDLRARHAEALSLSGRWADAAEAYERAARASANEAARIELLDRSAVHLLGSGRSAQGLPRLREVFIARGVRWPATSWLALLYAGLSLLTVLPRLRAPSRAEPPRDARAPDPALELLLEGAGLITPYDLARGMYFMIAFASRALRKGEARASAVALAMMSSVLSSVRRTRAFALELASQACVRARELDHTTAHGAVALTFAAYTRIACGDLEEALALGLDAEQRLGPIPRAHSYQFWNARAVQSIALVLMGRMSEARVLYERTAELARELGDDLAMVGGDSPLRFLIADDVAGARALVARKQAVLQESTGSGALHRLVAIDRLMCGLYDNYGADVLWPDGGAREPSLIFFDPSVLHACCALQGVQVKHPRAGEAPAYLERALARLKRLAPTHAVLGMTAQLRAAQRMMAGDEPGARSELGRAGEHYAKAQMKLHAAIMRCRAAQLAGDAAEAERGYAALRELGVVSPSAWANMLAPGFTRATR